MTKKMTKTIKAVQEHGDVVAEGIMMVECGCAVDNGEVEVCESHTKLSDTKLAAAIQAQYITEQEVVTEEVQEVAIETKEETTMTKPLTKFQALKAEAVELGIDIKGLRSIKAVQAAIDAHNAQEVAETTEEVEPVAIELDYTQAITHYATDLLNLVSAGTDYATLAKRVSVNAYSILGAQVLSGVVLTDDQKATMVRHNINALGKDNVLLMTSVEQFKAMSGTELYLFALKLNGKPKLNDIEALREALIAAHLEAADRQKPKASEASRANAVSTNKPFSSAHAVSIYPNAVQFIADGQEYTFIINPQGKGVLRHGNNSAYMKVNYLKGLLYPINTKASRDLVRALGKLRATQPTTQGGDAASEASAKEKNSAAKKQQDTMTINYKGTKFDIPMSWYKQFVSDYKETGNTGLPTVAAIVDAWNARK